MELVLHSCPDYCRSFYLKALIEHPEIDKVTYAYDEPTWSLKPFFIASIRVPGASSKRFVVHNGDPVGPPPPQLIALVDAVFVTNYLPELYKNVPQAIPLYPHYPIPYSGPYWRYVFKSGKHNY